jgi:hypothetical protein
LENGKMMRDHPEQSWNADTADADGHLRNPRIDLAFIFASGRGWDQYVKTLTTERCQVISGLFHRI